MHGETIEYNPNDLPSSEGNEWVPVRDGNVFCAPACGAGCKYSDYQHAVNAAQAMINMLGHGWKPDIWENMGWHYRVFKGKVEVSFDEHIGFTASIRIDCIFDAHSGVISECDIDARQAVEKVVARLDRIIAKLSMTKATATLEPLALP
ncbi:MAG: hypothetical protein PHF20_01365 [Halothiobacillaceae bacterium]|nr:hypothetical protein [Halothiobacillaceae bacterium]